MITLGKVEPDAWLDELGTRLARRPGYEVVEQPGRLVVSRTYVSDGRLVGSVILGLFTAGVGLLLLTRRDTESFTVTVDDQAGVSNTVARVSGEWSADTESLISQAAQDDAEGVHRIATPFVPVVQEANPAPGSPVVVSEDFSEGEADQGDVTRRVTPPEDRPPVFVLRLDDGQSWTLASSNVVGRGPSPTPGSDEGLRLIEISDGTQSVSKNHAQILVDGEVIRVIDLKSTNGTAVLLADGQRITVDSEAGVVVPNDATVEIGERTFRIVSAGDGSAA